MSNCLYRAAELEREEWENERKSMKTNVSCMSQKDAMKYIVDNSSIDLFCKVVKSELGVEVIKEYQFHPSRKWRFDYAFVEHRVALEVEGGVHTGGRHIRPKGFINDMEKYNTAAVMGWRLLRCTPDTLLSLSTMNMLREILKTNIL